MEIIGEIQNIIYKNEINSYTIAEFETEEETTTVVGYLPFVNSGDTLKVIGKFVEHKEYGRQFKIDTFEKIMPQTLDALEKYLARGNIKGIGEALAKRIIKKFGEETIYVFKHEPKRLAEIIEKSKPFSKDGHPAKRTFQAIRIEVNNEIKPLYDTVINSIECLKENGRICIITFHSLEDRAVKDAFIEAQGKCTCPKDLPYCVCNYKSLGQIVNKKPIEASKEELEENTRSRIFERKEKEENSRIK